ncbi:MAG: NUDIX domain-containing protein [Patescibacteria group bacterium]|nr:NUDIX domain-containing protein [Patescibacteria group bacterium]MCL5431661.1 NUDIX domain-containing protein [Patescibacteria group bacterium]
MAEQLHRLQLEILKKLLFAQSLRHTDLRPSEKIENNLLGFHLKQLIRFGLVEKKSNRYFLTVEGKEFASRIDTHSTSVKKQSKLVVHLCPIRRRNGLLEFLIYTRAKQPFYGCQGLGSGKVFFGETAETAARRVLKEETNLEGEPKLISARHIIYLEPETNKILDDRTVLLCAVENPTGQLQSNKEGTYEWVKESSLARFVKKPFLSFADFQNDIQRATDPTSTISFGEIKTICTTY